MIARPSCRLWARHLCSAKVPHVRIVHRIGEREVREYTSGEFAIQAQVVSSASRSFTFDAAAVASYFLPKGYPSSVGEDYIQYAAWCAAAGACSSGGGVLATQSLLCAVGVGANSALPLAASLNWVLKDGVGQLAAVMSAAVISDRFDADPKRWRAVAAYSEAGARCLNASTPFAPWAFLPIASIANLGYSVACLAASATKADFHRSLTRRQNLGDITGKAGSQAITASLVGTGMGLSVSAAAVSTPTHAMLGCLLFTAAQLFFTERAMQALALPTLTPAVGAALLKDHLNDEPLPTPAQVAASQRHISAPWSLVTGCRPFRIRMGSPSLLELAPDVERLHAARAQCAGAKHLLSVDGARGEVRVVLLEGAIADDVLLALLHAGLVQRELAHEPAAFMLSSVDASEAGHPIRALLLQAQRRAPSFVKQLGRAGWDVSSAARLEEVQSRLFFSEAK